MSLLEEFSAKIFFFAFRTKVEVFRAQIPVTVVDYAECVLKCVLQFECRILGVLPNFLQRLFFFLRFESFGQLIL